MRLCFIRLLAVIIRPWTRSFLAFAPSLDEAIPSFVPTKFELGMYNRRVHRWAKHVHPGLLTLDIASTQRVESTNAALKPAMKRSGTLVDVHQAIVGKVQDDTNKTTRWAPEPVGYSKALLKQR